LISSNKLFYAETATFGSGGKERLRRFI